MIVNRASKFSFGELEKNPHGNVKEMAAKRGVEPRGGVKTPNPHSVQGAALEESVNATGNMREGRGQGWGGGLNRSLRCPDWSTGGSGSGGWC